MSGQGALVADALVSSTFDALASSRWVLVSTWGRTGEAVATPVAAAVVDGRLWFVAGAGSDVVARVAVEPRVAVARCTRRGRPTGPTYAGTARVLDGAAAAAMLPVLRRRLGVLGRLLGPPLDHLRVVEVSPARARR